jgi:hypothetical protein
MPGLADKVLEFIRKYPYIAAPALGAGVGGTAGGIFSEEGAEGRGALQGALLGAGMGGLGAAATSALHSVTPTAEHALMLGALGGGAFGGLAGQRRLGPWGVKQREMQEEEKRRKAEDAERRIDEEAQAKEQDKEAAAMDKVTPENARAAVKAEGLDKEALDARVKAFDFGVDLLCEAEGIDKKAFAEAYGLQSADELTPAMIACLNAQLVEAK